MQKFYWKADPDGITQYTDLSDTRGEYKPIRSGLYGWRIIWEGLTLAQGLASSPQEAMGFVANWSSARQGSILGESLTVLMDEVKRTRIHWSAPSPTKETPDAND